MKLFIILLSVLSFSPALAGPGHSHHVPSSALNVDGDSIKPAENINETPVSHSKPAENINETPVSHSRPAENINEAISALVMISTVRGNGTGFFIDKKTVVTNFHILYRGLKYSSNLDVYQGQNSFSIKRILALSALHDLAVLEVEEEHHGPYLKISDTAQLEGKVYTMGFPRRSFHKMDLKYVADHGIEWLFSAGRNGSLVGASGSPVLDDKAQVQGVILSGVLGDFVHASKLQYLKETISKTANDLDWEYARDWISEELYNLEQQAEEGNPSAEYRLGTVLRDYLLKEQESKPWFKRAAEKGHIAAMNDLGSTYIMDFIQVRNVLKTKADMGSAVTTETLAAVPEFINNMSASEITEFMNMQKKEAARYFRMAAEKGYPSSQYSLGMMIKEKYIDEDMEEAFYWCKLAHDQGHHYASQCASSAQDPDHI